MDAGRLIWWGMMSVMEGGRADIYVTLDFKAESIYNYLHWLEQAFIILAQQW